MSRMCKAWPVLLALLLSVTAIAPAAFAQPHGARPDRLRHDGGGGRMSGEERQRLREDLQRQHAGPRGGDAANEERARRYAEWQRLSPEQREGIRREMRDANREFDRR